MVKSKSKAITAKEFARIEAELLKAQAEIAKLRRGKPVKPERNVAHFLREWRIHRGYKTQSDLARATNGELARETICRLESGQLEYRQQQLEKLAALLDCTPANLISLHPNDIGTIFEIYAVIPPKLREQAARVLPKPNKPD